MLFYGNQNYLGFNFILIIMSPVTDGRIRQLHGWISPLPIQSMQWIGGPKNPLYLLSYLAGARDELVENKQWAVATD